MIVRRVGVLDQARRLGDGTSEFKQVEEILIYLDSNKIRKGQNKCSMCYEAGAEDSVPEYVRKRDGKSPGTDSVRVVFLAVLEGLPGRMGLVRNPFIPAERQSSLVDS